VSAALPTFENLRLVTTSMMPTLFITLMDSVLPADTMTKSNTSHQRGELSLYLTEVFCVSLGLHFGKLKRTRQAHRSTGVDGPVVKR
jgi:hypothetical protein